MRKLTDLAAWTQEDLELALADLLSQAKGVVLEGTELQSFYQIQLELLRRTALVPAA